MEYNKLNGNNMKIIFIFSLVIFFTSCKNNNEEYIFNKDTFVLQNKELEEQIIKYKKFVYEADSTSISKGDSVTFHVFYKALNDSLDRFVIESIIDPEIVRTYRPYQSVKKLMAQTFSSILHVGNIRGRQKLNMSGCQIMHIPHLLKDIILRCLNL